MGARSVQSQVIVAGYEQLPVPHKRVLSGHLLLTEHPKQPVLGEGRHFRNFVVAKGAHSKARSDGDFVEEVEVVQVVVGVVLVLTHVVFDLVAVGILSLRDVLLGVGETQLRRAEVRDSALDQGSQILEVVQEVVPKVVLNNIRGTR